MKKIIFAILNLFQILYAQQSPLIVNNYQKLTSYDELSEFVDQLEKSSKIAAVETIGKSIEGRNIYVLKFSSTEFGQDDSKIKVLVFAQQHGNEQSGKEGALLLAEELLKSENKYLFDKIDFALIPQMNPDGSEANKRRNGNDADLNRDHLILDQPENIALHKFFDKYLFEVSMDVHEYYPFGEDWKKYGYRRNFDETIGAPTNINVSAKIRDLANEKCIPYIFDRLREKDFTAFSYILGGPPEVDLMRYSTFDINDGRQSFAIQNTFSFIQEGMNAEIVETESIQKRAEGQMNGMLSLLEFTYNNKEEIKNLVKEEREKLINNGSPKLVAIQLEHISDGSKLEIPLFSYHSQKDSLITMDDFRPVVKSLFDVDRPIGYLFPKELNEIKIWAEKQNINFENTSSANCEKVEEYHVERIDSIDFEGDLVVNPILKVNEISEKIDKSNYYFIPLNQLKNNLIVIALEPKSMLGLVNYNKFKNLLGNQKTFPILRVVN